MDTDGRRRTCQSVPCANVSEPVAIYVQHWTSLISAGEQPLPLSSRDGKLLRIVAPSQCLTGRALQDHLAAAMDAHDLAGDCRHMLLTAWQRGGSPGRAAVALMRGYAYLQAEEHSIALRVSSRSL